MAWVVEGLVGRRLTYRGLTGKDATGQDSPTGP